MNRLGYGQRSGFSIFWLIGGLLSLAAAFWLLSQPESTQALSKLILPSITSTSKGIVSSTTSSTCQGTNCRNPNFADAALQSSAGPAPAVESQKPAERSAPAAVSIPSIKGVDRGTTNLRDLAQPSQKPEAGSPAYYQESGHDGGNATSGSRDTSGHSGGDNGSPTQSSDHSGSSNSGDKGDKVDDSSDGGGHH